MSVGYLIGVAIHGSAVLLTLVAPRRPWWLGNVAFRVAAAYNEVPFLFIILLVAFGIEPVVTGQLTGVGGTVELMATLLVIAGLLVIGWRGTLARTAIQAALDAGLGLGWRDRLDPELSQSLRRRPPLARILFLPFVFRPRGVERISNVSYGGAGRANLLDVYRRRDVTRGAPVLVYFHGGGFYSGRKSVEARALLFRLAQQGWVTVSANYRLRPEASFVGHLADAKRAVAWVREHAGEFGADASTLVMAGNSAGAQLSTIAALTQNDPRFQQGFEDADTSVSAVVALSGWFDGYYELGGIDSVAGPLGHLAGGAPPFFVIHGAKDSLAYVEFAWRTVEHLRAGSSEPVVYAELQHGQHSFDLFHSFRFSAVVDGVDAFAAWLRSRANANAG